MLLFAKYNRYIRDVKAGAECLSVGYMGAGLALTSSLGMSDSSRATVSFMGTFTCPTSTNVPTGLMKTSMMAFKVE